jgi:hypothetical protein
MSTPENPEAHPRRRRVRRWFVLLGGLVLPALGVVLVLYIWTHSADRELREAIADTDRRDPGWRFEELEAKRPVIDDERNGALQVLAVKQLLPRSWPAAPAEMAALVEDLGDLQPQEQMSGEQLRALRVRLQAVQPAVKKAEGLADFPEGRHALTFKVEFFSAPIEPVDAGRTVASLLHFEALRRAQEGDADGACRLEVPLINAGRSISPEYTLLILVVRTVVMALASQTLERTLAQGEPAEASLAAVQQQLQREEEETPALTADALRGERALAHRMLEATERGELSFTDLFGPPSANGRVNDALNAGTLRHAHAVYLRWMAEAIDLARTPGPVQTARLKETLAASDQPRARREGPAIALMAVVPNTLDRECCKLAQLRCAVVAVALERCRRAEGRWPDSLEALAPRYLQRVPTDPYDGRPLRYRRLDDGVVVYSVGPDLTDDGGHIYRKERLARTNQPAPGEPVELVQDSNRKGPLAAGNDIGFRLWDPARRRQPAPPPPPAEEK